MQTTIVKSPYYYRIIDKIYLPLYARIIRREDKSFDERVQDGGELSLLTSLLFFLFRGKFT